MNRQAPVFGVGYHVTLIKIVRHDLAMIQQGEAQVQELLRAGIHSAQQYPLIAYVAISHVEECLHRLAHQWGHLPGINHVRVYGDVDPALACLLG